MLKRVLIALVVIVGAILGVAALQPDELRVERSRSMEAPPSAIYSQIIDFREWRNWSPWDALDPDMERAYSGPEQGLGATYAWTGDEKVGKGRMKIVEAEPGERVVIDLVFEEPFAAENVSRFDLRETGEGSEVTWTMTGEKGGLVGKLFGLFMDFDEAIGKDFEKGLAQLESAAQRAAQDQEAEAEDNGASEEDPEGTDIDPGEEPAPEERGPK